MAENLSPTVCLDGSAIRRIREEKKLTQFYVAKVVGVTTDTISRWENNRYPSIKRENALRLAEALEVLIDEILQLQKDDSPAASPVDAPRSLPLGMILLATFALLLIGTVLYFVFRGPDLPAPGLVASRVLPPIAAPGGILPVRVRLDPDPETKGYILREHFPPGWKLIEASPPASSLNNEEGTARWIVKPEEARHVIVYLLRVGSDAKLGGTGHFSGEIVANPNGSNTPTPVGGLNTVEIAPYLWADLNGDNKIDDSEMLTASEAFEEMKGVHLDWNQLEDIWDGEGYRWDSRQQRFFPVHPRQ